MSQDPKYIGVAIGGPLDGEEISSRHPFFDVDFDQGSEVVCQKYYNNDTAPLLPVIKFITYSFHPLCDGRTGVFVDKDSLFESSFGVLCYLLSEYSRTAKRLRKAEKTLEHFGLKSGQESKWST